MAARMRTGVSLFIATVCICLATNAALDGHCLWLGAVLPPPKEPSASPYVKEAVGTFKKRLDEITARLNHSSIVVGVKSIHESKMLLRYTFTPPELDRSGVTKVDENTIFRLVSVSKVFPVLAILKLKDRGVDLHEPVTKYLPEIRDLNKQARSQTPV
jgi:hypothetical protein